MSTYIEILSESSYHDFLKQFNNDMPYEEIHEFFENAIIHETNFSDNFIENFDLKVYRIRKELLTEIIYNSTNVELYDKWSFALNDLQFIDNYEYLYFFIN